MLAGQQARPARVDFTHAPSSSISVYRKALGCELEFSSPHCGFDLRAVDMQQRLSAADVYTRDMAKRYLETSYPDGSCVSDQVKDLIYRMLSIGHCSFAPIADALAMHPRSLQRALKNEGNSYEGLLEAIRKEKAKQYLARSQLRFSQIAAMLGYSDQSTFNRACKRWFNGTPKQLRAKF